MRSRWTTLFLAFAVSCLASAQVTTSQYDNARTGADLTETVLTPQNVNANGFGKIGALKVDGAIYVQPLYVPHLRIPGKGTHDVVFVATEHDSVYAFDATGKFQAPLWHINFLNASRRETTLNWQTDVNCPFIAPEIGITSTPVIDPKTLTLYALARTKSPLANGGFAYYQRLHALDITTGAERAGSPITIQARVPGGSSDARNGQVFFDPLRENPRAAILLTRGVVFLTWASSCDIDPYHGWIMAYEAKTLRQLAVFNTSPDRGQSSIFAGDTGPASDDSGNIFLATANGDFDGPGGRDWGDTVLRLTFFQQHFVVKDFFTPHDQSRLNEADLDLGSGGVVILPDQPGSHPHLLVIAGKGNLLYLIDRDRMGGYQPKRDEVVQEILLGVGEMFGAPAFWNQHLYILGSNDALSDFALKNGKLSPKPVATWDRGPADPGATPTVSANGAKDGIVWIIGSRRWTSIDATAVLHAYEAANIKHELYNSDQNRTRDQAAEAVRFAIPTVANGRVYVGAFKELDVYSLLSLGRTK